jgi:tetratricopeptide (TPR) repeat protein
VLLVCALARPALAGEAADRAAAARSCFQRGLNNFGAGKYAEAMDDFLAGWALERRPLFLFNAAQAARRAGKLQRAYELYRQFVQDDPGAPERPEAEQHMAALELKVKVPLEPVQPPPVEPPRPPEIRPIEVRPVEPTPAETKPPAAAPWWRDKLGVSLLGVGGAALIAGVVTVGVGGAAMAGAGNDYASFDAAHAAVPTVAGGGVVLGVGVALVAGAGIRLAITARRAQQSGVYSAR